jgi:6-phosphogluconolactonase
MAVIGLGAWLPAFGAGNYTVYTGTYTKAGNPGIQGFRWNSADGSLKPLGLMAETSNPSWLVIDPTGKYLYSAGEDSKGTVSAFSIDPSTGKLTLLNTEPAQGSGPCHLSLDRSGRFLFVANYSSGSITVFPLGADGRLGEASDHVQHEGRDTSPGANASRQEGPHAHFIFSSPDNRFVLVADLGLNEVLVYRFDPNEGSLKPNDPPFWKARAGSGPRHLAFSPDGKYLFVVNELSATVTMLAFDAHRGSLKEIQDLSMVPPDFKGENTGAEIQIDASGKHVYASNRGHDSIAVFAVQKGSMKLVQIASTLGKEPRHFTLDPSGDYLLAENQNSDDIAVFHVDKKTGRLRPSGLTVPVTAPVCLVFNPAR